MPARAHNGLRVVALRRVEAVLEREPWAWARENHARIAANWDRRIREKPALFNGIVLICVSRAVEDGVLAVRLREADYASFLAMHDFGFPEPGVGNCFGVAALRSGDGAYLLGEMGAHTANGGKVYFPGGSLDRNDVRPDDSVDIAGSVERELLEETGLGPDTVTFDAGWTGVLDGPRIALLREARSDLPAEVMKARIDAFLAREAEPELSGIRIVRGRADIDIDTMPAYIVAFLESRL
ncbi:MAG: NUDIX hydrolase [Pseudochelatococcus sp.]|jgi:8-oxo-dGTP pyrophosphatase MutT (NUDIX family)|uniref:NUDIX hydrolase n=1 Tax=Pseudochelatococcus sp. TaxID=2020869 RepID=UPI003D8E5E5F